MLKCQCGFCSAGIEPFCSEFPKGRGAEAFFYSAATFADLQSQ